MRVYYQSEKKMKISLDSEDLTALGVSADDFGEGGVNTRELIDEILILSGAVSSRNQCNHLLVDMTKKENGGCVLYFSLSDSARIICYEFDSAEQLMDGVKTAKGLEAKLYYYDGKFYLIVKNPTEKQRIILSEFARIAKNKPAMLEEHAKLVTDDISSVPLF